MCQPEPSTRTKPLKFSRSTIPLSPLSVLPLGALVIISFLAGCILRLSLLPHDSRAEQVQLCLTTGLHSNISLIDSSAHSFLDTRHDRLPSGQQLTIQLQTQNHVNETVLIGALNALEQTIDSAHSQHCSNQERQVICLSISFNSHVAIHAIPHTPTNNSTIIINIFTRSDNNATLRKERITYTIETISALFPYEANEMKWSHKLRGYRDNFLPANKNLLHNISYIALMQQIEKKRKINPLDHELGVDVLRRTDDKKLILHKKTRFQNVHVYELPRRRYNGLALRADLNNVANGTVASDGMLGPDRALYLDGVLQSSLYGDASYHEGLVHPGVICHDNPQRIAIIGGGEGATLREVLKHRSVTHVKMLEIDEELVHISKEVLPEWSDCGDILMSGGEDFNSSNAGFREEYGKASCFDDVRVDVQFVDAFQWFIDNHGSAALSSNTTQTSHNQELFDVIIMDALDPDDFISFADKLYNNTPFIRSISNALSPNGVFIVQLGASPDTSDPSDESGSFKNRANMINRLVEVEFKSVHIYEEGHCDFFRPWTVLVAFKNYEMRANWHRNSAEIEIQLQKRIRKTKSGRPPLVHFDAATMIGYQIPAKSFESLYCRQEDEPEECDEYLGFWPDIVNIPISEVKVQKSTVSEQAGRGIFAVTDIPENSMIDLDQGTKAFHVAPMTWEVFDSLYEWSDEDEERSRVEDELSALKYFIEGYGYACQLMGETHHTIDSGIMTFSNHGCNGSYNYGDEYSSITESSVDLIINKIPKDHKCTSIPYSPLQERHMRQILSAGDIALQDIKAGEEILVNYVTFADPEEWIEQVRRLRDQCDGKAVGEVSEYESDAL